MLHYFLALYVGTCYNQGMNTTQIIITSTAGKTLRIVEPRRLVCGCPNRTCKRATLLDACVALGAALDSLTEDEFYESDAETQAELATAAHKAAERECDAQGPGLSRWFPTVPTAYIPDYRDARNDAAMDAAKEARLGY